MQRQSCGFVAGLDIPHTFTAISNSGGNLNIFALKDPLERTGYLQNRLLGRLNMEDYDLITQYTADTPVP